jgi:uncharacterized membrane protein
MGSQQPQTFLCPVGKEHRSANDGMCGEPVHDPVARIIRKKYPQWSANEVTWPPSFDHFDAKHVQDSLEAAKGELSELEDEVIKSLEEHGVLSKNLNIEFDRGLTFGERVADKVTEFGGSWTFISIYVVVLIVWAGVNSFGWFWRPFDPYPYIFLNLILSAVAAMQAPIILMSQNRQDAKDRLRSEHDYRVNLKAELEIRHLSSKMDKLLSKQWSRLLEIQQMQTELLKTSGCNDSSRNGN